jgi:DNA polymerase III sliding clamp (beta) subunit (PCNA family)
MAVFHERITLLVTGFSVLAILSGAGLLAYEPDDGDDELEISLKQLPEAIRKALADVEVDEIEVEAKGDRLIYEVVIEADDIEIELELTADSRLVGVEIEREEDEEDNEGRRKGKSKKSDD